MTDDELYDALEARLKDEDPIFTALLISRLEKLFKEIRK